MRPNKNRTFWKTYWAIALVSMCSLLCFSFIIFTTDLQTSKPVWGSLSILAILIAGVSFLVSRAIFRPFDALSKQVRLLSGQRSEQEAVFSSMAEGVLALDQQLRLKYMNPSAAHILAVPPEFAKGKKIHDVILIPELTRLLEEALTKNMTTEGDIDHEERVLRLTVSPLHDSALNRAGLVIVMSDITRLRQLENHRRDFVANVSHELRTPLTSIQGFAETLMNPAMTDNSQRAEFLGIIHNHANRLGAIIEDLLALSRLEKETEREEIALSYDRIRPVLEAAIELCRVKEKERHARIELTCPHDLYARINAPLLEQAVVNLLDNAIKYGGRDNYIQIIANAKNGQALIRVVDHGPGISPEHLPRIFERFYRVDKARSRNMGGTGLGLAIVKHIALAHRGGVEVRSELGQGTEFTLAIPQEFPHQDLTVSP